MNRKQIESSWGNLDSYETRHYSSEIDTTGTALVELLDKYGSEVGFSPSIWRNLTVQRTRPGTPMPTYILTAGIKSANFTSEETWTCIEKALTLAEERVALFNELLSIQGILKKTDE